MKFVVQNKWSINFSANWTPNTYTIQYRANGGAGSMNSTTCTYDQRCTLQNNTFSRNGYSFNGWKWNGTLYNNQQSVNNLSSTNGAQLIFEAQWTPIQYTITYDLKGGTNHSSNPNHYTIETATFTLQNPIRANSTFVSRSPSKTITQGTYGNKTFTANWECDGGYYTSGNSCSRCEYTAWTNSKCGDDETRMQTRSINKGNPKECTQPLLQPTNNSCCNQDKDLGTVACGNGHGTQKKTQKCNTTTHALGEIIYSSCICNDPYISDGNGGCKLKSCPSNQYMDGSTCRSCPSDYPYSSAGSTSENQCYKTITGRPVTNTTYITCGEINCSSANWKNTAYADRCRTIGATPSSCTITQYKGGGTAPEIGTTSCTCPDCIDNGPHNPRITVQGWSCSSGGGSSYGGGSSGGGGNASCSCNGSQYCKTSCENTGPNKEQCYNGCNASSGPHCC